MSTNALIKFYDTPGHSFGEGPNQTFYVYQHWDGYPAGVAITLAMTFDYAFKLPRWQANDFSAAFIAANKNSDNSVKQGGNIYISDGSDYKDYEYHVTFKDGDVRVKVLDPYTDGLDPYELKDIEVIIFEGTFREFIEYTEAQKG